MGPDWFEKMHPLHVERAGAKNIMFETDYPHSTSLDAKDVKWVLTEGLANIDDETRHRILWANAAELYGVPTPAVAGA